MCDHCGCRQGSIQELMDQHDVITAIGSIIRRHLAAGNDSSARLELDRLLSVLEPHVEWEEAGLFPRLTAQGDFAEHVATLESEHAALYRQAATAGEGEGLWGLAILDLLDELDEHIYRENFGLFPGAISVLEADDWAAIDAAKPPACRCGGACDSAGAPQLSDAQ